ncbi:MAG: hypothetical protein LBB25_01570 [Holosporaceae bacterium]|jgi:molecular chaperone HscB|nr:hypothetical protein [Holosporaceae bacterium]
MNYFEKFGIPVGYKIDENALVQAYLQEQSSFHPDANEVEFEKSALLNKAYKVLSNPIDRAKHFLEIHGKYQDVLDPEFSVEAFNLREKYETLATLKSKKKFQEELAKRISELIATLYKLENNLDAFQKNYGLLRFINSFLEKVRSDAYGRN